MGSRKSRIDNQTIEKNEWIGFWFNLFNIQFATFDAMKFSLEYNCNDVISKKNMVVNNHNFEFHINAKLRNAPGSKHVSIKQTVWVTKMSHQNNFAQFGRWHRVQSDMQLHKQNEKSIETRSLWVVLIFYLEKTTTTNVSDCSASLRFVLCVQFKATFTAIAIWNQYWFSFMHLPYAICMHVVQKIWLGIDAHAAERENASNARAIFFEFQMFHPGWSYFIAQHIYISLLCRVLPLS